MGPPDSRRVPRDRRYSGYCGEGLDCRLQGFHLLWPDFPIRSTNQNLVHSLTKGCFVSQFPQHRFRNASRLHGIGLGSCPFARRYSGNRGFFLFLQVLRCFSSLRSLPCPMCSDRDLGACSKAFPHLGNLRIFAWLAAPRSLSQPSYVLHRLPAPEHPP